LCATTAGIDAAWCATETTNAKARARIARPETPSRTSRRSLRDAVPVAMTRARLSPRRRSTARDALAEASSLGHRLARRSYPGSRIGSLAVAGDGPVHRPRADLSAAT
jgi:hypothetical protein